MPAFAGLEVSAPIAVLVPLIEAVSSPLATPLMPAGFLALVPSPSGSPWRPSVPVRLPFRPPGQQVATPSLLTTPFDVKTEVTHAYRATADAVDSRETRTEQATQTRTAVPIVNALASTDVQDSEQLQTTGQT